jgi:tRNA(fMet)-specific endonuclease VapC
MGGKYLLDTNVVIAFLNGETEIGQRLETGPEIFLSAVVFGELSFGAVKSNRPQANMERLEEFSRSCTLVGTDTGTGRSYGQLKLDLRRKGRPIPENDIWIAACALQHDLTLVTRDRHFKYVEGLPFEAW